VFASDSRTECGWNDFASFSKMTVFERAGDRVLCCSAPQSGWYAGGADGCLRQRAKQEMARPLVDASDISMWIGVLCPDCGAERSGQAVMPPTWRIGADSMRRSGGGQLEGEPLRLFRICYAGRQFHLKPAIPHPIYRRVGGEVMASRFIDRVISIPTRRWGKRPSACVVLH